MIDVKRDCTTCKFVSEDTYEGPCMVCVHSDSYPHWVAMPVQERARLVAGSAKLDIYAWLNSDGSIDGCGHDSGWYENSSIPLCKVSDAQDAVAAERVKYQAALAQALMSYKKLYRAYVNLMENGRDRILELGGRCDPVDYMEKGDPALIDARAAIATIESMK